MVKATIWMLGAPWVALAIAFDMRRLVAHRVGLTRTGWLFVCACAGPLAIIAYLICRRAVFGRLVHAVWDIAGDGSHTVPARRSRLIAMRENGLIGAPVFRRCMSELEVEDTSTVN
ncbi:hypothetical protein [Paraburkholderia sp. 2C]